MSINIFDSIFNLDSIEQLNGVSQLNQSVNIYKSVFNVSNKSANMTPVETQPVHTQTEQQLTNYDMKINELYVKIDNLTTTLERQLDTKKEEKTLSDFPRLFKPDPTIATEMINDNDVSDDIPEDLTYPYFCSSNFDMNGIRISDNEYDKNIPKSKSFYSETF